MPEGLTASAVISSYLTAIGGEKAARAVQSVVTLATGTVQGFPVELTTKTTSNHQQLREVKAMGMTMMKQVVSDKNTYVVQQGQKVPLSATFSVRMRFNSLSTSTTALSVTAMRTWAKVLKRETYLLALIEDPAP